jgi:glutaredoxin
LARFEELNAQVLGISIDHIPCLQAWAESLGGISYPLLSDFWPHGEIAERYGVLRDEGRSERAIFIFDRDGVIRYIDIHDIDDQPDNEVIFGELSRLEGVSPAAPVSAGSPVEADPPEGGVVMYCTPWCPDCRRAKDWLEKRGVTYREVDINADAAAAERVKGWTGGKKITPTFDVDGTIVVNFDRDRLEKLLG